MKLEGKRFSTAETLFGYAALFMLILVAVKVAVMIWMYAVSYTHLTLPTN